MQSQLGNTLRNADTHNVVILTLFYFGDKMTHMNTGGVLCARTRGVPSKLESQKIYMLLLLVVAVTSSPSPVHRDAVYAVNLTKSAAVYGQGLYCTGMADRFLDLNRTATLRFTVLPCTDSVPPNRMPSFARLRTLRRKFLADWLYCDEFDSRHHPTSLQQHNRRCVAYGADACASWRARRIIHPRRF